VRGADHPTSQSQPPRAKAPPAREFARACHPDAIVRHTAVFLAFAAALSLTNCKEFVREMWERAMRAGIVAGCVALALLVGGCDPATDRRYTREGAGIDLYTADRAGQIDLLNQYILFVCAQSGPSCNSNWTVFVQAGMNDIDLRCDGFLTWLDARRRDREPIIAEISAINTAVHGIMTVTGSSPASLDIVTAVFGLASASYANWNSRLLISANQSTVQEIVYTGQGQFREKIKNYAVPDQPAAIYLLRNYLRLCMPITIEASINTSATLVQRGAPMEAQRNLVVTNTMPQTSRPTVIRDINAPMSRVVVPASSKPTRIGPFEQKMSDKDMKVVLEVLCLTGETDLGPAGSPARTALSGFLIANSRTASTTVTNNVFFDLRELRQAGKRSCS
jgi:hypothetical protein